MNAKECAVLNALTNMERPNAVLISKTTHIPLRTVENTISNLRKHYQIEIDFVPPARTGYYQVRSWGLFESGTRLRKYIKEQA